MCHLHSTTIQNMTKRVLYLSEDYNTSKVHHNLCQNLSLLGNPMVLFSIHRNHYSKDLTSSFEQIDYEKHINQFRGNRLMYKYIFPYKQHYKYHKLSTEIEFNDIGLCHASTLFSDGATALKLKKERGIPYIVSVRGTDTDLYAKKMIHLWKKGKKILRNAEKIIFISPALKDALLNSIPFRKMKEELKEKIVIIPNGIDDIWLKNIRMETQGIDIDNPRIIYIGVLDNNKNVLSLMDAIDLVAKRHSGIRISIVGGNGNQEESIKKRCEKCPERYQMLGKIYDKNKLREQIRQHDIFTMVSHGETFGLVYIEALSQGLPVLFSKGRGIDGFFQEKIGEGINPESVEDIANGLNRIIEHYNQYDKLNGKIYQFSWAKIAEKYEKIYSTILEK